MHLHETSKTQKIPSRPDRGPARRDCLGGRPKRRERPAARAARLRFQNGKSRSDDGTISRNKQSNNPKINYSRRALRNMCEAQVDPADTKKVTGNCPI